MNNYYASEDRCQAVFENLKPCWHLWTPENFEIIFRNENDLKVGMCLVGICAKMFPEVIVHTFELMSNHLHLCVSGNHQDVMSFFHRLSMFLRRFCAAEGYTIDWLEFKCETRELTTLEDMRNVIVYINRNGYLVQTNYSPFTYPWGANKYFFNPDSKRLATEGAKKMTLRARRALTHSRLADEAEGVMIFDGYATPTSFCDICTTEKIFHSASNYFYRLGKNIEANKKIAKEISESIFYTDDELYAAIRNICLTKYGFSIPSQIPASAKLELARTMRFDYNASPKQIQRMLKVNPEMI